MLFSNLESIKFSFVFVLPLSLSLSISQLLFVAPTFPISTSTLYIPNMLKTGRKNNKKPCSRYCGMLVRSVYDEICLSAGMRMSDCKNIGTVLACGGR